MNSRTLMSTSSFALVIDGQVKAEFETREGAVAGAKSLKRRFPLLQIEVHEPDENQQGIDLAASNF